MSSLPDGSGLLALIKQAAVDAVEQRKPVEIVFGTVVSLSPLQIRLSQKIVLQGEQIIRIDGLAQELTVGSRMALLRMQGGQRYLIQGKVVN